MWTFRLSLEWKRTRAGRLRSANHIAISHDFLFRRISLFWFFFLHSWTIEVRNFQTSDFNIFCSLMFRLTTHYEIILISLGNYKMKKWSWQIIHLEFISWIRRKDLLFFINPSLYLLTQREMKSKESPQSLVFDFRMRKSLETSPIKKSPPKITK